jgi:ribonuclease HII
LPSFVLEEMYEGMIIAGIDEVGCGAIAGPVFASAVILNKKYDFDPYVNDSKLLSIEQRNLAYEFLLSSETLYSIGIASNEEIDRYDIRKAIMLACARAVQNLPILPDICLVDGNMIFEDERYKSFVKGDQISYSIAAASIIAKVTRDFIMSALATEFHSYRWNKNKGYGTKFHIDSLKRFGPTPYHRRTFIQKHIQ